MPSHAPPHSLQFPAHQTLTLLPPPCNAFRYSLPSLPSAQGFRPDLPKRYSGNARSVVTSYQIPFFHFCASSDVPSNSSEAAGSNVQFPFSGGAASTVAAPYGSRTAAAKTGTICLLHLFFCMFLLLFPNDIQPPVQLFPQESEILFIRILYRNFFKKEISSSYYFVTIFKLLKGRLQNLASFRSFLIFLLYISTWRCFLRQALSSFLLPTQPPGPMRS